MKTWFITAALISTMATASLADGGFWVVGNNQTNTCDIVTSTPTLDVVGARFFSSGPYKSKKDAKLARSTIPQFPKVATKTSRKTRTIQNRCVCRSSAGRYCRVGQHRTEVKRHRVAAIPLPVAR